jgi:hypothetical protein
LSVYLLLVYVSISPRKFFSSIELIVNLSICLSVCPSIDLTTSLYIYLSICVYVCRSESAFFISWHYIGGSRSIKSCWQLLQTLDLKILAESTNTFYFWKKYYFGWFENIVLVLIYMWHSWADILSLILQFISGLLCSLLWSLLSKLKKNCTALLRHKH